VPHPETGRASGSVFSTVAPHSLIGKELNYGNVHQANLVACLRVDRPGKKLYSTLTKRMATRIGEQDKLVVLKSLRLDIPFKSIFVLSSLRISVFVHLAFPAKHSSSSKGQSHEDDNNDDTPGVSGPIESFRQTSGTLFQHLISVRSTVSCAFGREISIAFLTDPPLSLLRFSSTLACPSSRHRLRPPAFEDYSGAHVFLAQTNSFPSQWHPSIRHLALTALLPLQSP
jgi:hypothetical protein